jgi:predicted nucleotidyltransferase
MSVNLAVRKTIEYAKIFGCHINVNEIKKRLISRKIYSEEVINKEISRLNWKNKKNKWEKVKLRKARILASQIKNKFKDILFLGISGSVATGHPKKNDDIDILVITKNNTLWKNRFSLRWWMYKNKIPHRKYNKTELKDQFCFNLWLDENYLKIPRTKQNLKNAIDLILLKPLINNNMTYEKLLLANSWVKKFVATPYNNKTLNTETLVFKTKKDKKLNKYINFIYFLPQYLYMKPKIMREKIGFYQAFFHG